MKGKGGRFFWSSNPPGRPPSSPPFILKSIQLTWCFWLVWSFGGWAFACCSELPRTCDNDLRMFMVRCISAWVLWRLLQNCWADWENLVINAEVWYNVFCWFVPAKFSKCSHLPATNWQPFLSGAGPSRLVCAFCRTPLRRLRWSVEAGIHVSVWITSSMWTDFLTSLGRQSWACCNLLFALQAGQDEGLPDFMSSIKLVHSCSNLKCLINLVSNTQNPKLGLALFGLSSSR